MSAPEYLYRVSDSGALQTFKVVLGHGTYVNVQCQESGEYLPMQNRFNLFRDTPQKAWACRATSLEREMTRARGVAKAGLRRLAMLNRIRTEYSRKQEDIKAAEDRVWTDLTGLVRMQNELHEVQIKASIIITPETNAHSNTGSA